MPTHTSIIILYSVMYYSTSDTTEHLAEEARITLESMSSESISMLLISHLQFSKKATRHMDRSFW